MRKLLFSLTALAFLAPAPGLRAQSCTVVSPGILDSTFEAGTPWPAWTTQTSTNFFTPLCNTAGCGTGGGTAPPFAGDNWAWFGGISSTSEAATLGQSLTFATSTDLRLRFQMRIGFVSSPFTDTLVVRVSGATVQTFTEPSVAEGAYTLREINVTSFATGASRPVLFSYTHPNAGTASFTVDNVELVDCGTPPGSADLSLAKGDSPDPVTAGNNVTYTLTVTNNGPDTATGITLTDTLPSGVSFVSAVPGSPTCTNAGQTVTCNLGSLANGAFTSVSIVATVAAGATGSLSNTASVASAATDPNGANNSASESTAVNTSADLSVAKTDSADPAVAGGSLTYTVTVTNNGPSTATGVSLTDTLPAGVTFVSSTPGSPTCTESGGTVTCNLGTLAPGSTSVSIDVSIAPSTTGTITNTATATATTPDPTPGNDSDSEPTTVNPPLTTHELVHGSRKLQDLSVQPDLFAISQKGRSSYEVVVDAAGGDVGAGAGPLLRRVASDGSTVLQTAQAVGNGPARSLRWHNTSTGPVDTQFIRVESASCTTDCGADDTYRIRVYETTYAIPRFNNAGSQITVLILQNPADYLVAGIVYFWSTAGSLLGTSAINLPARNTLVLNTSGVAGVTGQGGSITVAHDGRYGDLAGKTVALEPASGFSFDSPMVPRMQ